MKIPFRRLLSCGLHREQARENKSFPGESRWPGFRRENISRYQREIFASAIWQSGGTFHKEIDRWIYRCSLFSRGILRSVAESSTLWSLQMSHGISRVAGPVWLYLVFSFSRLTKNELRFCSFPLRFSDACYNLFMFFAFTDDRK